MVAAAGGGGVGGVVADGVGCCEDLGPGAVAAAAAAGVRTS